MKMNRRAMLQQSLLLSCSAGHLLRSAEAWNPSVDTLPQQSTTSSIDRIIDDSVSVLFPRDRVPLTFIIDDSTCLVNMGHFCMPQFAAAWPDRDVYKQPWHEWPREIPDSFVREFGEWCAEHGVKGKYSIVPNPACVGWLDRELPGWSRRQLRESIRLVQELMMPNWDIHPEMITHTRVIDLSTGRPLEPANAATMENSYPQEDKSVDEMASYLAYALRILRNCELPCEGITTPGGFGNRVKSELSLAAQQSLKDVFSVEIPHYFKYVKSGDESTEPTIEHYSKQGEQVDLTVNIPAGTGDWFGGWDGVRASEGFRYSNNDATEGRMVELIEQGRPAFMLCHWPGLYNNGTKEGLTDFQNAVVALHQRFADRIHWMKLNEIARYWAVKETSDITREGNRIEIQSHFQCPDLTISIANALGKRPVVEFEHERKPLTRVESAARLEPSTWLANQDEITVCVGVEKGKTQIRLEE